MTLEPKSVEPGYLKRWAREAAGLVGTNFHLWFVLMLIPAAAACLLGQGALPGLLLFVLGFFTHLLSAEFAVTAEHGPVQIKQVPAMVKAAWQGTYEELWRQRRAVVLTVLMVFAFVLIFVSFGARMETPPGAPAAVPDHGIVFLLFSLESPLVNVGVLLFVGVFGLRRSSLFGYLAYPLQRMHGLSAEVAEALVAKAAQKNMSAAMLLDTVVCASALGAVVFYPGFAPLLLCLLPAMSYAACRDMFGPGAKPLHVPKPAASGRFAGGSA